MPPILLPVSEAPLRRTSPERDFELANFIAKQG